MLRKESSPRPILEAAEDDGYGPAIAVLAVSGAVALFAVFGMPTRQHVIHLLDDDNTVGDRNLHPVQTLNDAASLPAFGKLPSQAATAQQALSSHDRVTPKQANAVSFSPEIQQLLAAQKELSRALWGGQRPFTASVPAPSFHDLARNNLISSTTSVTTEVGRSSSAIEQAQGVAAVDTFSTEDSGGASHSQASGDLDDTNQTVAESVSLQSAAQIGVPANAASLDGSQASSLAVMRAEASLTANAKTPSVAPSPEPPAEPRTDTEPVSSLQMAPAVPALSQACIQERCLSPEDNFAPSVQISDGLASLARQAATVAPVMPAARAMASNTAPLATPGDRFPRPQF